MEIKCKNFPSCGGCQLLNLSPKDYEERKLSLIPASPREGGVKVKPLIYLPADDRRRARFQLDFGARIGFFKPKSHDIVPINSCPVLRPELNEILPELPRLFKSFVKRSEGEIELALCDNGLAIRTKNIAIMPQDKKAITEFCEDFSCHSDASRNLKIIDWAGVYAKEPPIITLGDRRVPYDSRSFLQPCLSSGEVLLTSVKSQSGNPKKVLDLFCGLGLFSFAFKDAEVDAFDCDEIAIKTLINEGIQAKSRDLFSKPIKSEKLSDYDLIVLDPPRDGAEKQCREIAASEAKNVIYVSCNPATFARDYEILKIGGWHIDSLQPIDQFIGSGHLELVASLHRD